MIRRSIITFLIIIVSFVLQTSLIGAINPASANPNLMLIVTVTFALLRGDRTGLVTGFFCGLLTDVFFGNMIGFYALLYMITGFYCARYHRKFYPENLVLPFSVITVADLFCGVACYLFLFATRARYHVLFYLTRIILPEAVFTLIAAFLLYPVILKINTWLEDIEQRSARKFV